MPELPEVETTRRHLDSAMSGKRFSRVVVRHARTARHNGGDVSVVSERLVGRKVESVGRTGKFIIAPLDDGMTLVAHLGMSGRFGIDSATTYPHTHFEAELDDGTVVTYVDPRTFGFIAVMDDSDLAESGVSRLGPDAWDNPPTPAELIRSLEGRTAPIKALLLDQGPMAGLGNIYADESLFAAGIDPRTVGGALSVEDASKLLDSVRSVLSSALDLGGTSLGDLAYLLPDGRAGDNLGSLNVYGRAGEPCPRCGDTVDKVIIRQRSTHFCPGCQVRRG